MHGYTLTMLRLMIRNDLLYNNNIRNNITCNDSYNNTFNSKLSTHFEGKLRSFGIPTRVYNPTKTNIYFRSKFQAGLPRCNISSKRYTNIM